MKINNDLVYRLKVGMDKQKIKSYTMLKRIFQTEQIMICLLTQNIILVLHNSKLNSLN